MFESSATVRKIEKSIRLVVPQLLLVLFVILSFVTLPLTLLGEAKPYLILMIIYYWSIYRPTLVPPALCFIVGIVIDTLSGMPLGLNAAVFVAVRWVVSDQRRFLTGQPYITVWAAFGVVCSVAAAVQWALYGLVNMQWTGAFTVAMSVGLSLLVFPLISLLLIRIHRLLPVASRTLP